MGCLPFGCLMHIIKWSDGDYKTYQTHSLSGSLAGIRQDPPFDWAWEGYKEMKLCNWENLQTEAVLSASWSPYGRLPMELHRMRVVIVWESSQVLLLLEYKPPDPWSQASCPDSQRSIFTVCEFLFVSEEANFAKECKANSMTVDSLRLIRGLPGALLSLNLTLLNSTSFRQYI